MRGDVLMCTIFICVSPALRKQSFVPTVLDGYIVPLREVDRRLRISRGIDIFQWLMVFIQYEIHACDV